MEKNEFETILTSKDVMNIQDGIGKGLGTRERTQSIEFNAYFIPRLTSRPHATPNYVTGNISLSLIIIDRHIVL